jgi:hypothetical protein
VPLRRAGGSALLDRAALAAAQGALGGERPHDENGENGDDHDVPQVHGGLPARVSITAEASEPTLRRIPPAGW